MGEKIAPLPFGKNEKKKKINVENDEYENGKNEVVNNGNDKVETLLDFEQNEKKKTEIAMDPFLNDGNDEKENVKDGNSSDDLDAFFNEMEQESDDEDKIKKDTKKNEKENEINDLMDSHEGNKDKKNKNEGDDDDEWGW